MPNKPQHNFNFHDDAALHDQTPEAKPWYSNLGVDSAAVLRLLGRASNKGFAQAAKDTLAELDVNDPLSKALSKELVSQLWGSMLHPPHSFLGHDYKYRTADGSNNNILYPHLGKAGGPYAKTVQGKRAKTGAKPDAGDLFDLLMSRDETRQVESSSGLSSMLLYNATLIIHDIFRTDTLDKTKSDTSSYLDLTPLYGNNDVAQRAVRLMERGLLKPDTFAEHRLLNQPPGVCAYLIMYNRFHNYVAQQLLEINEDGRFAPPNQYGEVWKNMSPEAQQESLRKSDEEIFQTARLITCGMYAQIAIHDYLRCLMVMHTQDTAWTLDPRFEFPERNNKAGSLSRGEGNMVSVEFNLLYRFHSPISVRDAEWSTHAFRGWMRSTGKVKKDEDMTEEDLRTGSYISESQLAQDDIPVPFMRQVLDAANLKAKEDLSKHTRTQPFPAGFGGMVKKNVTTGKPGWAFQRDEAGYFDDEQLVTELTRAIEDPIAQFGAQNIPKIFKSVEILGMLDARKWEIATLNEFRQFFGMSRHKHFEDINSDPEIQQKLRDLYEDPDLVELYPGLFCEGDSRNLDPGVSCPGGNSSALWRGVFSDAVTLVRSDRFYTTDWNVDSLTAWGLNELKSDPKINKGSVFHRLFQRAFPGYFPYNSIHMWQPFYTPAMNLVLAEQQGYLSFLDLSGLQFDQKPITQVPVDKNAPDFKKRELVTTYKNTFDKEFEWVSAGDLNQIRALIKKEGYKGLSHRIRRSPENIASPAKPDVISSYSSIRSMISDANLKTWINPGVRNTEDIPAGALREILTGSWGRWDEAIETLHKIVSDAPGEDQLFINYFAELASSIREREQRGFQRYKNKTVEGGQENYTQVYQIDVVKDYSIPLVTRFLVDFLGVWDQVKTVQYPNRLYDENQIYQHLDNCQDFQSWDADETKTWSRRVAYKESIRFLHALADQGVANAEWGLQGAATALKRSWGGLHKTENQYVNQIRNLARRIIASLGAKFSRAEVVAVILAIALDISHKIVLTFTEIVAYFIDPTRHDKGSISDRKHDPRTQIWTKLKSLAEEKAETAEQRKKIDDEIKLYVLEAQRLSYTLKLAREYRGTSETTVDGITIKPRQVVLLDLAKASQDETIFQNPEQFEVGPTRNPDSYLVYGDRASFTKQLTLASMTGMLKHLAQLKSLRVAHDKMGRLKRVTTPGPDSYVKYATTQWDRLVPFPATWNLRFDGVGPGVFTGGDNANQGHGQDQVWRPYEMRPVAMAAKTEKAVVEIIKDQTLPQPAADKLVATVVAKEVPAEVW